MREKEILFTILRTEICGESLDGDIKNAVTAEVLEPLYVLAKKHDLAPIVGHTLGRLDLLGEDETSRELKKQTMLAVGRYMYQNKALGAVCKTLERCGIDHIPLKGSVLRKYYPQPWMRTSCDIDILVKEQTLEEAVEALCAAGFRMDKKGTHDITLHSPDNVCVELHYSLIEEAISQKQAQMLKDIWDHAIRSEESPHRFLLPDDWFFFFHIAHMAKHIQLGGCGIKPFVDTWILEHRVKHDKALRCRLLEQGDLLSLAEAVEKLTRVWLEGAQMDLMSAHLEAYTLDGGVYGTPKGLMIMQQIQKGGKLRYALDKIFLPYDILKRQYPILEKHRWLMPVYQVRRWFKLLFLGGVKRSVNTLKRNADVSPEEISSTEDLLRYLGL